MGFPGRRRRALANLPTDLLMKIMALLPVPQLFQLLSVSKSWNSILDSPAFLEAWSVEAPSDEVWFVMATRLPIRSPDKDLIAYSNSLGKWFRFPIFSPRISSSLGASAFSKLASWEVFCSPFRGAAAGGLVCSVVDGCPGPSVIVFNPLTGAARRLRRPPKRHRSFKDSERIKVLMFANSAANSYHVVLVDKVDKSLAIFDSKSNSWKVGQDIVCATECGDVQTCDVWIYRTGILYGYKIEMDTWTQMAVRWPHGEIHGFDDRVVIQYQGRTFLVTSFWNRDSFKGFKVSELQVSGFGAASWLKLTARTHHHTSWLEASPGAFRSSSFKNMVFHNIGPLICILPTYRKDSLHDGFPLVYDVSHDSWYHLPVPKGTLTYTCLFSCQPSLVAVP